MYLKAVGKPPSLLYVEKIGNRYQRNGKQPTGQSVKILGDSSQMQIKFARILKRQLNLVGNLRLG